MGRVTRAWAPTTDRTIRRIEATASKTPATQIDPFQTTCGLEVRIRVIDMDQVRGTVVLATGRAATTETRGSYRRTTNRHTFADPTIVGLGCRQSGRERSIMGSEAQDMVSRTTSAYRQIGLANLSLNRIGKAQGQGSMPMFSPGSTSRKVNRLLQRDGKMGQGLESHPERLATGLELITEALGTTAIHEIQAETEYLKSTIGRRAQFEKRTQAVGQASLTGSTADQRKGTFPKIESRPTPFQGNQPLQSQALCQDNSPRTNSKAQGSRDSRKPLTSPK